jgi:hypothetical protein
MAGAHGSEATEKCSRSGVDAERRTDAWVRCVDDGVHQQSASQPTYDNHVRWMLDVAEQGDEGDEGIGGTNPCAASGAQPEAPPRARAG